MAPKSNAKAVKAALRFKLDATALQRKRTVKRDHSASFKRDSFVVLRGFATKEEESCGEWRAGGGASQVVGVPEAEVLHRGVAQSSYGGARNALEPKRHGDINYQVKAKRRD